MLCKSCGSESLRKFNGEIVIRSPGLKNLDRPVVWVFPELVVCMDCGIGQFAIPEGELRLLDKDDTTAAR